jgi:hypothetical protein
MPEKRAPATGFRQSRAERSIAAIARLPAAPAIAARGSPEFPACK